MYLLKKSLFGDHPYSMRYSGEMDTVARLKRDDLINFYHAYCVPNNMVISVSGDIDPKDVSQKTSSLFKDLPRRALPERPAVVNPPDKISKGVFKVDKEQALLMVGFRTVGVNDPDRYTLDMLETLLSGMSGRLFASIRDKSGLSYALGCAQKLGLNTGMMVFYVATTKDNLASSRDKLFAEIKLVRDSLVTDEELNFAKAEAINNYKLRMQTNSVHAFQGALDELYGLGYDNLYKYEERIRLVTKEDIKKAADKYFNLSAYSEVVIEPE
jgi:zinc protease